MKQVYGLLCLCLLVSACATKPQGQSGQFSWKEYVVSGVVQKSYFDFAKKPKNSLGRKVAVDDMEDEKFIPFLQNSVLEKCFSVLDLVPFFQIAAQDDKFENLVESNKDRLRQFLTNGELSLTPEEKANPEFLKCAFLAEGVLAASLHSSNPFNEDEETNLPLRLSQTVGVSSPRSQIHLTRINSCKSYKKIYLFYQAMLSFEDRSMFPNKTKAEIKAEITQFGDDILGPLFKRKKSIEEALLSVGEKSNPEALSCAYYSVGFVSMNVTNGIIFGLVHGISKGLVETMTKMLIDPLFPNKGPQ